jgi:hypothetical protein
MPVSTLDTCGTHFSVTFTAVVVQHNAPMGVVPAAAADTADSVNAPRFTEKDVDELYEVFPNVTKEVITSVLIEKVRSSSSVYKCVHIL